MSLFLFSNAVQRQFMRYVQKQPPDVFFKRIGTLKNFLDFSGKHLLESIFNKVAALQACIFIKKRLKHKCFPVNIAKF